MGVLDTAIAVMERQSGKSANVTLRTLTLGNADSITGHYAKSFAESTIKMLIQSKGSPFSYNGAGFYSRYPLTGFTSTAVLAGDEIKIGSNYYSVKSVPPTFICAEIDHYQAELEYRPFEESPTTSGTWHTDSATVATDPRNRIKVTVDTYLTANNIKKDDGTTNASTVTCFDGATYPITRVFLTKAVDAAAVIS